MRKLCCFAALFLVLEIFTLIQVGTHLGLLWLFALLLFGLVSGFGLFSLQRVRVLPALSGQAGKIRLPALLCTYLAGVLLIFPGLLSDALALLLLLSPVQSVLARRFAGAVGDFGSRSAREPGWSFGRFFTMARRPGERTEADGRQTVVGDDFYSRGDDRATGQKIIPAKQLTVIDVKPEQLSAVPRKDRVERE